MISPELAKHHATCHTSNWRGLSDGLGHPNWYVHLTYAEFDDLLRTGSFTLPPDVIPESVRKWRQREEIMAEITGSVL